jgi:hypothetical protein
MPFFDDITRWLESLMFIRIKKASPLPRKKTLVQCKARREKIISGMFNAKDLLK